VAICDQNGKRPIEQGARNTNWYLATGIVLSGRSVATSQTFTHIWCTGICVGQRLTNTGHRYPKMVAAFQCWNLLGHIAKTLAEDSPGPEFDYRTRVAAISCGSGLFL
jgi:hypothetical protein